MHAYESFSASQKLMVWHKPDGTASGTEAGYIKAADAALVMAAPLTVNDNPLAVAGADLTVSAVSSVGGNIAGVTLSANGGGAYLDIHNTTSSTANKRRFRHTVSFDYYVISGRNDAGTSTGDILTMQNTLLNVGIAGMTSFGGGSKVFGIPDAATAPTTNPAAGGVLYSVAGALTWRGSSGTVTTIAPA